MAICLGTFMASANSFEIAILGRGGHGNRPHMSTDITMISTHVLVRLQGIVSRLINPISPVVSKCGSIHKSEAENIIPDRVDLKLNVRTYDSAIRKPVLDTLKGIIKDECKASGASEEPIIKPTT